MACDVLRRRLREAMGGLAILGFCLAAAPCVSSAHAQTVVSLTFDDGIATQNGARPVLASHGMHGTFYVNSGLIGANSYYMTWPDVDALAADGNEIGGHTLTHQRLTNLTADDQRHQICDDAANLRARGYTITDFAYPYGAGSKDANVRQALQDCGYQSARIIGDLYSTDCTTCPYAESIPPRDTYRVRDNDWLARPFTLQDMQGWVTQAEQHGGGWVPIYFHDFCNGCDESSVTLADFTAFLDWLQPRAVNGTVVKTVRDVISPPPPPPVADLAITKGDAPDPVETGANLTYTLTVHNTGPDPASAVNVSDPLPDGVSFVSASSTQGSCSGTQTVSCDLGTVAAGAAGDVTITIVVTPGAAAVPGVTNTATVSSTTSDPDSSDNEASADTTVDAPPPPATYVRPKGATPLRVALVPAYLACDGAGANDSHGDPLAFPSCNPPQRSSSRLTIGTPDANGTAANASGFVRLGTIAGDPATPADEADVTLQASMTDVREASDLSDYAGELDARATVRLTDKRNGAASDQVGTVGDFDLEFAVPCAGTADTGVGSACAVTTTADALTPGMVPERTRAIWELGQVRLLDGGADGVASTADNSTFAVQGVFVP